MLAPQGPDASGRRRVLEPQPAAAVEALLAGAALAERERQGTVGKVGSVSGGGVGAVGIRDQGEELVGVCDLGVASEAGCVLEVLLAGRVQFHGEQHGGEGASICEAVAAVQNLGVEVAARGEDCHGPVEPVAWESLGLGDEAGGGRQLGGEAHGDEVDRCGATLGSLVLWGSEAVLEDVDIVGGAVFPHQR